MSTSRRELLDLLDRLCEGRLSAEEHARLDRFVSSDDEALGLYVDYIALHGTLQWDTALGADTPVPAATPAALAPSAPGRKSRRRRVWVTAAACLVLAVGALALVVPPGGEQVADTPHAPGTEQDVPIDLDNGSSGQPQPLPNVQLDRRERAADPQSVATADAPPADPHEAVEPTGDIVAYIDQQLAARWEDNDVAPSPRADDAEWVRRASLDLSGRIPDLDTVRSFLDADDPDKRQQYVARLLRGGEFAAHLTTVWANLLVGRSAAANHERRGLEEFLLTQFRQNRPWNETVGELIAAEGTVDENGAAGFLLAHLNNEAVPATAMTARLFLGEQVQCSQCHKHPWYEEQQETFWTLNAFFQQTHIERRIVGQSQDGQPRTVPALVTREEGGPTYYEDLRGVMQVAYPQYGDVEIEPDAGVNRRRELARLLAEEDGHQLARAFVNRMWAHFFGYGFVNPIDDMGPHQVATHPELLDRLAEEFVASGYNVAELVRWITSSQAYQLTSRVSASNTADNPDVGDPPLFSRVYVKPLAPEQLFDSVLVATAADRAGSRYESDAQAKRREWVQQFFEVVENEENGEETTFDGTVPQALAMMNGPLVDAALSGEPGTVLHSILTGRGSDADKVRNLCLSTLGREPTEQEQNLFTRHVRQAGARAAKLEAYRDVLWAYLNSSEFVVNH
jgi:hypothetical protein